MDEIRPLYTRRWGRRRRKKNTHRKMEANLHTAQALQFSDERRNEFEEFHSVVVVSIRRLNTLSNTSAAIAHPLAFSPSLPSSTLHYASHQVHQWRENHPNLARFQNELIRKVWLRNSKKVWLRARAKTRSSKRPTSRPNHSTISFAPGTIETLLHGNEKLENPKCPSQGVASSIVVR